MPIAKRLVEAWLRLSYTEKLEVGMAMFYVLSIGSLIVFRISGTAFAIVLMIAASILYKFKVDREVQDKLDTIKQDYHTYSKNEIGNKLSNISVTLENLNLEVKCVIADIEAKFKFCLTKLLEIENQMNKIRRGI